MTLYQYDMYMSAMPKIEQLLNPRAEGKKEYDYGVESTDEGDLLMQKIVREAEAFGVKPPKYQPDRW